MNDARTEAYLRLLNSGPGWETTPKRGARKRRRDRKKSREEFDDFYRRWNNERPE